jgi:NAD-dependent deacetylase
MAMHNTIPKELISTLQEAKRIVVLTGAGISAESSVPTFRDPQIGLWSQYRPEELATPQAFQRNPALVWEWYEWRRGMLANASPNLGHDSLVIMETRVPNFVLITQNIDGLHQQAGSEKVIELHGNIFRNKCFVEGTIIDTYQKSNDVPPRCPNCGAYIRPDVVWFGESLSQADIQSAWDSAMNCDVFFSIGTSSLVQPAASLPSIALDAGATVLEINITETPLTPYASHSLLGPAGEILPELVRLALLDKEV